MEEKEEKYISNWDTLRKTVTILNEDNSIYAEYDYLDFLQFRIQLLQEERLQNQTFYVRNVHGGRDKIDEYARVDGDDPFAIEWNLLNKLVKLQMKKRIKESEENKKK